LVIEGNRQAGDGGEVDDNQEDDGPQAWSILALNARLLVLV
jgi:hypothetical protein